MIDLDEYRDEFEERCLAAGLVKLDESIDTKEFLYCVFVMFNDKQMFFRPAIQTLIDRAKKEEDGEFYQLLVSLQYFPAIRITAMTIALTRGNNFNYERTQT